MLSLVFAFGLTDCVSFSVWSFEGRSNTYNKVPQELFNEHFGRFLVTNPHNIRIEYDQSYYPKNLEEQDRVDDWPFYGYRYDLDTENENEDRS